MFHASLKNLIAFWRPEVQDYVCNGKKGELSDVILSQVYLALPSYTVITPIIRSNKVFIQ